MAREAQRRRARRNPRRPEAQAGSNRRRTASSYRGRPPVAGMVRPRPHLPRQMNRPVLTAGMRPEYLRRLLPGSPARPALPCWGARRLRAARALRRRPPRSCRGWARGRGWPVARAVLRRPHLPCRRRGLALEACRAKAARGMPAGLGLRARPGVARDCRLPARLARRGRGQLRGLPALPGLRSLPAPLELRSRSRLRLIAGAAGRWLVVRSVCRHRQVRTPPAVAAGAGYRRAEGWLVFRGLPVFAPRPRLPAGAAGNCRSSRRRWRCRSRLQRRLPGGRRRRRRSWSSARLPGPWPERLRCAPVLPLHRLSRRPFRQPGRE